MGRLSTTECTYLPTTSGRRRQHDVIGQSHGFLWFCIRGIALQSAVMQSKHSAARLHEIA